MSKDNQREAIAYIAGVIDGEGSIRMQRSVEKNQNPKYMPMISVVNTHRPVVELVARYFGGTRVYRHDPSTYGFKNRKICYKTVKSGTGRVKEILLDLYPYLIIKKKQASLILEYLDRYSPVTSAGRWGNYRDEKETRLREGIYQKIRALNAYSARND